MTLSPPLPSTRRADSLKVIATNRWDEVRPCLSLIHDGFVEAGFMSATRTGLRVIPEYLNPGSIFFLCTSDDEPVGTMAWVADGPNGVPSDRAFRDDVDAIRSRSHVTENSSFTVKTEARRMTRQIVLHMFGAAAQFLDRLDTMVTSVMPTSANFYGHLFGFEEVASADDLFGAPASMLAVDRGIVRDILDNPPPRPQCRILSQLAANPFPWFVNHFDPTIGQPRELTELACNVQRLL